MKRLLLTVFLFMLSASAMALNNWSYMSCNGTDTTGKNIYLTAYSDSSTVNINGNSLKVVGKTRNGQGVVTESFIATNGVVVYDSIVPTSNTNLSLYQFNAVTESLLAQASLSCGFNGNNTSKLTVIEQSIFKTLKK
jgi:hypothetical protein